MKMQSTDGKHQLDWKIMNWHCLNSLQLKLTTHVYVFLDLVHVGSIENNCARRTPNLGSYFFKNPKSGILFLLSKQIGSRDPIFRIPLPLANAICVLPCLGLLHGVHVQPQGHSIWNVALEATWTRLVLWRHRLDVRTLCFAMSLIAS